MTPDPLLFRADCPKLRQQGQSFRHAKARLLVSGSLSQPGLLPEACQQQQTLGVEKWKQEAENTRASVRLESAKRGRGAKLRRGWVSRTVDPEQGPGRWLLHWSLELMDPEQSPGHCTVWFPGFLLPPYPSLNHLHELEQRFPALAPYLRLMDSQAGPCN